MIPCSRYRRGLPRALRAALCIALPCVAAACGTTHAPSLTPDAARYRPVSIATGVPSRPGAVAWSPDGNKLAFISRTVTVVDVDSDAPVSKRIDIQAPRFLAWAGDGTLSVLTREGDQDVLFLIDTARPDLTRKVLDRRADAVYPLDDQRSLLLALTISPLKFGTEVRRVLSLLNLADGEASTLHSSSRILPAVDLDEVLLTAWTQAGLNPLDGSFLIMEHVKPPVLAPYSRVQALDLASGELLDIGDRDRRTLSLSADWSPDGRKIALTDSDGNIEIRDVQRGHLLNIPAAGLYPAWHPAGDLLVVGGTLVSTVTGTGAPLLRSGGGSIARWSPDGTRLALITGGELLLFRNFQPAAARSSPLDHGLKRKLSLLQELLQDDLISREEYRARRSRLLSDKEGGLP